MIYSSLWAVRGIALYKSYTCIADIHLYSEEPSRIWFDKPNWIFHIYLTAKLLTSGKILKMFSLFYLFADSFSSGIYFIIIDFILQLTSTFFAPFSTNNKTAMSGVPEASNCDLPMMNEFILSC